MSYVFMKRVRTVLLFISGTSMILYIFDVHIVFGWLACFTFYTWFILFKVRPERTYEENWVDYDEAQQADEDEELIENLKAIGWADDSARRAICKTKQLTNH